MEFINQWLGLIISSSTLVMLVIAVYKFSADPDAKADKLMATNEVACNEKHKRLDEIIAEMKDRFVNIDTSLTLIKENDIKHIENEMRKISQQQTKILTILEYKEKEKEKI
jgi:vacuolar-type H+-ATPase subunit F/Vma7